MTEPPECDYLTIPEFAKLYRCSPRTVRRKIARGELPGAVLVSCRWRIPRLTSPFPPREQPDGLGASARIEHYVAVGEWP